MDLSIAHDNNATYKSMEDLIEDTSNTKVEPSMEDLTYINRPSRGPVFNNECGQQDGRPPKPMFHTRIVDKTNKADWTFILNNVYFNNEAAYNEFVMCMSEVEPNDTVFIYGPAVLSYNMSNIISSAIITCKSKNISISIPYVYSLGSLYFLSHASRIVYSPYDVVLCGIDEIRTGGGLKDAWSTLEMYKYNYKYVAEVIKARGLLSDDDVDHLFNAQAQILCFGQELMDRYKAFNSRKSQ
jgi:hypothetical protein